MQPGSATAPEAGEARRAWPAWARTAMIKTRVRDPAAGPAASRRAGEPGKMGVMDIRAARMQDAPEIAVVHVRSWQAAYRGLLPQAYLDGLDPAQRIGRWERSLSAAGWSDGGTLVADAGACPDSSATARRTMTMRSHGEPISHIPRR